MYSLQVITDEDFTDGLSMLADRFHKPSNHSSLPTSIGNVCETNIVQKCPTLSMASVTMPTEVMPFTVESHSLTSSAGANQMLVTDLSTADWPALMAQLQADTTPTTYAQNDSCMSGTNCVMAQAPLRKTVVRLVVTKPLTSVVNRVPIQRQL